jgi:hypothetical protein
MESPQREPGGASLAEAEIGEDHVEQILDVEPAGDATEAAPGEPQILRSQLRQVGGERAAQRVGRDLQRLAMTRPGQQRRGAVVIVGDAGGERGNQFGDAVAGQGGDGKRIDKCSLSPIGGEGWGEGAIGSDLV